MLRNVTSFVALLAAFVLIGVTSTQANPANRSVGVVAGTYTEITGGTVIFSSASPNWYSLADQLVTLPFQFSYGGVLQSNVYVGGNGWVTLCVPEPSSASLLMAGAFGLVALKRRRKKTD